MNRLAQSLICLSDPLARIAYDTELGLPAASVPLPPPPPKVDPAIERPAPVVVAEPLFDEEIFSDDSAVLPADDAPDMTQVIELPYGIGLEPPLWPDEPVPSSPYEVVF